VGSTSRLPTVTGSASEASKLSPLLLVFVLMVWSIVTTSGVPASITTGGGEKKCEVELVEEPELELAPSDDVPELRQPHAATKQNATSHLAMI
jgi:hypothetical protein